MEARIDISAPLQLLGGLSPSGFMKKHWQKKPLLIRQAIPHVKPPVSRAQVFKLAADEAVESRLIVKAQAGKRQAAAWTLQHGPLPRRALPPLSQDGWTVLVQGLDLHVPAARALLSRFRFVPEARLDDLMISYATEGGGVGPHFDSYDVFLLQVHGRRRWRIGRLKNPQLQADVPLKILTNFVPEQEWVLEPGDMLYLPPGWAHDGIAEGECMTCSVGFRTPARSELVSDVLVRIAEEQEDDGARYADPRQEATVTPGRVPSSITDWTIAGVRKALASDDAIRLALGESLSEPKPCVWFDSNEVAELTGESVQLDPRTRMMYDDRHVYANGASWRVAGADARMLRQLADQRGLPAADVARASAGLREWLQEALRDGWLHQRGHGNFTS